MTKANNDNALKSPMRAMRFTLKLEADDRFEMAHELRNMASEIELDELTIGLRAGPRVSAIYELLKDPTQSHERYFKDLISYLSEAKRADTGSVPKAEIKPAELRFLPAHNSYKQLAVHFSGIKFACCSCGSEIPYVHAHGCLREKARLAETKALTEGANFNNSLDAYVNRYQTSNPSPGATEAAIWFALSHECQEPMSFLRCWNEGEFDVIRRKWPEAPEAVFIGADPLYQKKNSL